MTAVEDRAAAAPEAQPEPKRWRGDLFPVALAPAAEEQGPEGARRFSHDCEPWCRWSLDWPHERCESLMFSGIDSPEGY